MKFGMKYCLPQVNGRGAGLGNELIPWARAFIVGSTLGAQTLAPAFGLNRRRYWRHFGTPRYDWIAHRALGHVLPRFEFTESDFITYGGDYLSDAARRYAEHHRLGERSAWVLLTRGMWGGYRHVIEARAFVRSTLTLSRFAAANLATIRSRLDRNRITVAMHVRLGDFIAAPSASQCQDAYRGRFNVSLPLEWYINIARALRIRLGDKAQFLIVSDGNAQQLAPLIDTCAAITTMDIPDSDVSDLLALADADLLVCSVSSYSLWAAFLSDAPYIWYEPHLQKLDGYYSIWGHHAAQREPGSYTRRAVAKFESGGNPLPGRGVVVPHTGTLPENLFVKLIGHHQTQQLESDLVHSGVLPAGQS